MERYYVGLDVSKEKTAICVRRSDGSMDKACATRTDPDAIFAALAPFRDGLERVILETGRMANWLYDELTRRGLPAVCVDSRQAHAVLGQMHNKTDTNDAAMLADLALTGFCRKVEVKSGRREHVRYLTQQGAPHSCRVGQSGRQRIDPVRSTCGPKRIPRISPGDVRALNAEMKLLRG